MVEGLIRLAVFGMPVAHSLSPSIHQRFALQFGLEMEYRAIEAGPDTFARKLKELAMAGGRGCNVTVPLKQQAWRLARRSSAAAQRAQAANTLVFEAPEDYFADNTDGVGLIRDLSRHLANPLAGARILIVGAGGATAGILGDLLDFRPAAVTIANRGIDRARALVQRFASIGVVSACALSQLDALEPFNLVIHATSLGHSGSCPDLPAALFHPDGLCYDLNYGPAAWPLRDQCIDRGVCYQDGLGMLVEQAAASFALWTGHSPDAAPVLERLRREMQPSTG